MSDLDECIKSILTQRFDDFEVIIVVDNNEKLYHILADRYRDRRIRIVLNDSERGQSTSMNCGVLNARGEIVCFTDDDAVVDGNWLLELMHAYDNGTYAVGGRIEPLWMDNKPSYLPEEFYWLIGATGNYLPYKVCKVRNLWSGNVSYRRDVFSKIGYFSSDLGKRCGSSLFQGEDAEFGLRLLKATGKCVKYIPTAIVYHKIYGNRVRLRSLLERAYWQGFSKAYIRRRYDDADVLSTEREFLKLVFKSSLRRLRRVLLGSDMITNLNQLVFMITAILAVLLGFIHGLVKTKP